MAIRGSLLGVHLLRGRKKKSESSGCIYCASASITQVNMVISGCIVEHHLRLWELHARSTALPAHAATILGDLKAESMHQRLHHLSAANLSATCIWVTNRYQQNQWRVVGWPFCPLLSFLFSSSVLVDQLDGYIVGTWCRDCCEKNCATRGKCCRGGGSDKLLSARMMRVVVVFCQESKCVSVVSGGALVKRTTEQEGGGVIIFLCCVQWLWHFLVLLFFFPPFFFSIACSHIVVVVHQRSFYSGTEDNTRKVLVEVLMQPGLLLHYWGKQVHLPTAAA